MSRQLSICDVENEPLPSQSEIIGALNDFSEPKDVVVCAAGSLPGDLHKLWRTRDPKGYHLEYGYSCMGYEVAGGLGRMRERVKNRPDIMKIRRELVEHPFGTLKRWWDQGFFLTRGLGNVRTEASLSVLAYNMRRAINILGVKRLIQAVS